MKFSLTEKGRTRLNTTFHVVDSAGTTVGSINIPHGQEANLQKCWRDSVPAAAATTAGKQARAANAMVAALKRGPRLSREGILRGC